MNAVGPFACGKPESDALKPVKPDFISIYCKCGEEIRLYKDMPFSGLYCCPHCSRVTGFVYEPQNENEPNNDGRASRIIGELESVLHEYSLRYGSMIISSVSMSKNAYDLLHGYAARNVTAFNTNAEPDSIMGMPVKVVEDQQVDIVISPNP